MDDLTLKISANVLKLIGTTLKGAKEIEKIVSFKTLVLKKLRKSIRSTLNDSMKVDNYHVLLNRIDDFQLSVFRSIFGNIIEKENWKNYIQKPEYKKLVSEELYELLVDDIDVTIEVWMSIMTEFYDSMYHYFTKEIVQHTDKIMDEIISMYQTGGHLLEFKEVKKQLYSPSENKTGETNKLSKEIKSSKNRLNEWIVEEAKETDLINCINKIHDLVQRTSSEGSEIVITLYDKPGVDKAEGDSRINNYIYDLIYNKNLKDASIMFGPVVPNDNRIEFEDDDKSRTVPIKYYTVKDWQSNKNSFIDREKITSVAKFKLGNSFWQDELDEYPPNDILGLLFVNTRGGALKSKILNDPEFHLMLRELEKILLVIKEKRKEKIKNQNSAAWSFRNLDIEYSNNDHIDRYFKSFKKIFEEKLNINDLSISVYVVSDQGDTLIWLWSSVPVNTNIQIRLINGQESLLKTVACDEKRRPILKHNLKTVNQGEKFYCVPTVNLNEMDCAFVVPVIDNDQKELLGVIEFQYRESEKIGGDILQLMYKLSLLTLAGFLKKVRSMEKAEGKKQLPLYSTNSYKPYDIKEARYQVEDLLALNFSPMKYLLHWERIREIIVEGKTSRPSTVEIWPSMVCNHHCDFCRVKGDLSLFDKNQYLKTGELKNISTYIIQHDDIDVLISGGGEPLICDNLAGFIREIADIKGTIGIFTNATRSKDYRFWSYFFKNDDSHRFVRVSFNGHDPLSYFRIHGIFDEDSDPTIQEKFLVLYANARKSVMDILAQRNQMSSVALGTTVMNKDKDTILEKFKHAFDVGVDFLQMRPELLESAHEGKIGIEICENGERLWNEFSKQIEDQNVNGFKAIFTDNERKYEDHEETECFALKLVPTICPDIEEGWIRVMPCSYAISQPKNVPVLGRIKPGADFNDFWSNLFNKDHGIEGIEISREKQINPSKECPQCRFHMLNKRIGNLKRMIRPDDTSLLSLLDQLVVYLKQENDIPEEFIAKINSIWDEETINIAEAKSVFSLSKKLKTRPSL